MSIAPCWIGIDVSKARLDLFDPRTRVATTLQNTAEALAAAAAGWADRGAGVAFEATGRYDLALRRALDAAGVPYQRLEPGRVRAFAKAIGRRAKTDPVDAGVIAAMAASVAAAETAQREPERDRLTALVRRRDQLVAMRAQEKTRLSEATDADPVASYRRLIDALDAEIAEHEAAIDALVAGSPRLRNTAARLRSLPGIGPVTATVLVALLPELGRRDPKRLASLVGLAPFNRDSGRFKGQRRIAGGRARVRRALYMAALIASRRDGPFAHLYRRLLDAGKAKKLALVAVARKILVTLNAIIRDDKPFQAA